jgi:diguanylate cyclase (GGDEF)-like protein/PAS domain S-box-containing protein
MYRILTCLTVEHDWRLVVLAAGVCFLASGVAISLFHRAQVVTGRERLVWLSLDAAAAGFGIWATHFIAMLAYDPGIGAGYNVTLTVLSLLVAILITGAGLAIALGDFSHKAVTAVGGAVVGSGVAAMHYAGMEALEVPARITWSPGLVVVSIALGIVWAAFALYVAAQPDARGRTLIATALLTLAIVSMHFTAMSAVLLVPDPTRVTSSLSLSPTSLSLVVAGAAAIILGMCFVAAIGDRRSKDKLRRQKLLLDAALANMSQGLCMFEPDGRIILFNERYEQLTGLSAASLHGHSLLDVIKSRVLPGSPEEFVAQVVTAMREGKINTRIIDTTDGRTLRVIEQPRQEGGWVSTLEDITEWQKAQAKISHMARHDALTNLPNRRLFRERLEDALRRVARNEKVAVFCLDLDRFKEVNDTLGHPVGDELLKQVARRLSECVREGDTVARLGGDEFAVVQVGGDLRVAETSALANRLIEVISSPYTVHDHQSVIGATVGISVAPDDGDGPDQLLKNADMALYRAKGDGRGSYRFFEAGMDARAQARRLLELDLRTAMSTGEFEVHYQPLLDIKTNNIICFEALLRWNHPQRGLVLPSEFISLAEETGLIIPIGDWVLRTACIDAARWPDDIHAAVNISPAQFKNRNLVASVSAALSAARLSANRLELEITESVLLQDTEATLATLHKFRALGLRISMDDFGTGYSSLSYLRSFPFDKIKIDRSFVSELAVRGDSMAIVRAVTGLGRSLGISTTAEGVETSEQLALLRSEGCDEVQGYLFSAAQPAAEVDKMLSKRRLRVVA